jgi:hypothetical protein
LTTVLPNAKQVVEVSVWQFCERHRDRSEFLLQLPAFGRVLPEFRNNDWKEEQQVAADEIPEHNRASPFGRRVSQRVSGRVWERRVSDPSGSDSDSLWALAEVIIHPLRAAQGQRFTAL